MKVNKKKNTNKNHRPNYEWETYRDDDEMRRFEERKVMWGGTTRSAALWRGSVPVNHLFSSALCLSVSTWCSFCSPHLSQPLPPAPAPASAATTDNVNVTLYTLTHSHTHHLMSTLTHCCLLQTNGFDKNRWLVVNV